jgi:hypothetical protein
LTEELHSDGNSYIERSKQAYEILMNKGWMNSDQLTVLQVDTLYIFLVERQNSRTENIPTNDKMAVIVSQCSTDAGKHLFKNILPRL